MQLCLGLGALGWRDESPHGLILLSLGESNIIFKICSYYDKAYIEAYHFNQFKDILVS